MLDAAAAGEDKGFIGERYDADAGLQYLNARYYDPKLAMFIQPDWFEVTAPGVGTNRYSYSANDPVNKLDSGGNAWWNRAIIKASVTAVKISARVVSNRVRSLASKPRISRVRTHKSA